VDIWQSILSSRVLELLTERLALLALGGGIGAVAEVLLHPVERAFVVLERLVLGWRRWRSSGLE
jgi:hypothetical protein